MLRIIHVAESANGGGAESVFRDTIVKLKSADTENIHLVACISSGNEPFKIDVNFVQKNQSKLGQIFSFYNYKLLKSALFLNLPDIIHIQNYGNLSPSILKSLYDYKKKHKKVRIIQTVHTYEHVCSHHAAFDYRQNKRCLDCADKRFKFKIFYRGCSRLGYIHSWAKGITSLIASFYINKNIIDQYLTPSNFLRQCLLRNNSCSSNVSVLRNPMNDSFLSQEFNSFNKKKNNFQFVYFGRFSEEKNLEVLIEGFKLFLESGKRAKLTMIGKGDKTVSLIDKCVNLGISSDVEFIDFLPINELIDKLKESHVSILSSKCFETASLVINEGVMCGIVPIVPNHGAMLETLDMLNVGLTFDSSDPYDLSKKLENVALKYDSYFNQLNSSIDVIKEVFNTKKYVSTLLEFYIRIN